MKKNIGKKEVKKSKLLVKIKENYQKIITTKWAEFALILITAFLLAIVTIGMNYVGGRSYGTYLHLMGKTDELKEAFKFVLTLDALVLWLSVRIMHMMMNTKKENLVAKLVKKVCDLWLTAFDTIATWIEANILGNYIVAFFCPPVILKLAKFFVGGFRKKK